MTRVVVTHFHPDHLGLAGWLARRFDAPLHMTRTEWLFAQMLTAEVGDAPPAALAYWRLAGWDEARIAAETAKGWGRLAGVVSPVPRTYRRLVDGGALTVGSRTWRVVTGSGHSLEHACLFDEANGVLIAGDQVLPRITSNVSLMLSEPEEDPLGDWLGSIAKLRQLPADLLVLPSHGDPFTGLHARLDALDAGHRTRCTPSCRSRAAPWIASASCSRARWTTASTDWRRARRWRIFATSKWRAARGARSGTESLTSPRRDENSCYPTSINRVHLPVRPVGLLIRGYA